MPLKENNIKYYFAGSTLHKSSIINGYFASGGVGTIQRDRYFQYVDAGYHNFTDGPATPQQYMREFNFLAVGEQCKDYKWKDYYVAATINGANVKFYASSEGPTSNWRFLKAKFYRYASGTLSYVGETSWQRITGASPTLYNQMSVSFGTLLYPGEQLHMKMCGKVYMAI